MPNRLPALIILIVLCLSFGLGGYSQNGNKAKPLRKTLNKDSLKTRLKSNIAFFGDHLLKGNKAVINRYMKRYQPDSCNIIAYKNRDLKANFEGVKTIKGIRRGKKADRVFVVPPFNYCDEGDSYCFYDPTLPRLYSESNCCHPNNLFVVQDIDEDGVNEIGIYYSSCSSRFKAIEVFSLKHGKWKQIADATFDTFTKDPDKVQLDKLVKKISKGKFRICNFNEGKTTWKTVVMK